MEEAVFSLQPMALQTALPRPPSVSLNLRPEFDVLGPGRFATALLANRIDDSNLA
jgi:hypothetical protein